LGVAIGYVVSPVCGLPTSPDGYAHWGFSAGRSLGSDTRFMCLCAANHWGSLLDVEVMMSQGTGLRDWLIQRFTAVFLGVYLVFFLVFLVKHPDLNYNDWRGLFSRFGVQIATIMALVSIGMHAWIGLYTVLTDYVKRVSWRYFLQALILLALFSYGVWGIMILWGE
jgi:succinate dehydrogenase / fumarate reductase, membrane anchor subunit